MGRNAIYLSGWEYNRLVGPDPTTSRQSCLPAEFLWNGAAQLWLFERVYCAKESLECEEQAAKRSTWQRLALRSISLVRAFCNRSICHPYRRVRPLPRSLPIPTASFKFRDEFNSVVTDALARARMGPLLDWTTKFVIAGFAAAVGYAATQLSGSPVVGGAVAVAAGGGVKDVIDTKLKASQQLTLFYQRVQRSQTV